MKRARRKPAASSKHEKVAPKHEKAAPSSEHENAATAVRDIYQKNFVAFAKATQALTEGVGAVFERQQAMLRSAMTQTVGNAHDRFKVLVPKECPEAVDRFRTALEAGLANTRDMLDLAEKSKRDAFASIQQRMAERFQQRGRSLPDDLASAFGRQTTAAKDTTESG